MPGRFLSHRSVVKHAAKQSALACLISVLVTLAVSWSLHGSNQAAMISVGDSKWTGVIIAALMSLSLAGIFAYRSGILLRKLDLARAEYLDLSRTDPLTGLFNRRGFEAIARDHLKAKDESEVPTAILMCDIDHFKAVNDKHGHDVGDDALIRIGKVLRDLGKEQEVLIGRIGGEEFAVMMPSTDCHAASAFAERIRQSCATQLIRSGTSTFSVTVSVGLAVGRHSNLTQLLHEADVALYRAKGGRNRIALFEECSSPAVRPYSEYRLRAS